MDPQCNQVDKYKLVNAWLSDKRHEHHMRPDKDRGTCRRGKRARRGSRMSCGTRAGSSAARRTWAAGTSSAPPSPVHGTRCSAHRGWVSTAPSPPVLRSLCIVNLECSLLWYFATNLGNFIFKHSRTLPITRRQAMKASPSRGAGHSHMAM